MSFIQFSKYIYTLGSVLILVFLCTISIKAEETVVVAFNQEGNEISDNIQKGTDSSTVEPVITDVVVEGEIDYSKKGIESFDDIHIYVKAENLTDDHFLTEEGLHWSDISEIEIIKGSIVGEVDESYWTDAKPLKPTFIYSIDSGDKGRITYVGKTKSGIDLDLIWTIAETDNEEWRKHHVEDTRLNGVTFVGGQYISDSNIDSIVVFPYGVTMIDIYYQIVRHGTMDEMPVLVNFITADIDARQGILTDFNSIAQVIPNNNIRIKDGVIYDADNIRVSGSSDLPQGGYLEAGFFSHFDYLFMYPAPVYENKYKPFASRYDLFGSALQVKMTTEVICNLWVNYMDTEGNQIKDSDSYKGLSNHSYVITIPDILNYEFSFYSITNVSASTMIMNVVYNQMVDLKINYHDLNGKSIYPSQIYTYVKGSEVNITPPTILGYNTAKSIKFIMDRNIIHTFLYEKQQDNKTNKSIQVTNKNIQSESVPVSKNTTYSEVIFAKKRVTTYYPSSNQRLQYYPSSNNTSTSKSTKNSIDWFHKNTGINKKDREIINLWLDDVEKEARKKYGNNQEKIDHEIWNAIGYLSYSDDFKQTLTNDFGNRRTDQKSKYYGTASEVLQGTHMDSSFPIDFPHLAVTMAGDHNSNGARQLLKQVLSFSLYSNGLSWKERFFLLNGSVGDYYTDLQGENSRDSYNDGIANVFRWDSQYNKLTAREQINVYLSTPNLRQDVKKRNEKIIKDLENRQNKKNTISVYHVLIPSLAGLALVVMGAISKRNQTKKLASSIIYKNHSKKEQEKAIKEIQNTSVREVKDAWKKTSKKVSKAVSNIKEKLKNKVNKLLNKKSKSKTKNKKNAKSKENKKINNKKKNAISKKSTKQKNTKVKKAKNKPSKTKKTPKKSSPPKQKTSKIKRTFKKVSNKVKKAAKKVRRKR